MPFFQTLPQQIWAIYVLSAVAFAFWRGGRPERLVAVAAVVASIASALLVNQRDWLSPQWGDLIVDLAFLGLLGFLAFASDRKWTLWATAFQLISVVIYVARMVDPRVGARAPYRAIVIWSYLIIAALAVGTWLHWRRQARESVA